MMNSKYKITKFKKNEFENFEDLISIEEPLEISLKYKEKDNWLTKSLSITMRTPGHDEDLVRGFLFNEQIIQSIEDIKSIGDTRGANWIEMFVIDDVSSVGTPISLSSIEFNLFFLAEFL